MIQGGKYSSPMDPMVVGLWHIAAYKNFTSTVSQRIQDTFPQTEESKGTTKLRTTEV